MVSSEPMQRVMLLAMPSIPLHPLAPLSPLPLPFPMLPLCLPTPTRRGGRRGGVGGLERRIDVDLEDFFALGLEKVHLLLAEAL